MRLIATERTIWLVLPAASVATVVSVSGFAVPMAVQSALVSEYHHAPPEMVATRVTPANVTSTTAAGVVFSTVPERVTPASFSVSKISSLPATAAKVSAGGVESTTTANAGELVAPVLPAASVAVAVIGWLPSAKLTIGVKVHAPEPFVVAVPSSTPPS